MKTKWYVFCQNNSGGEFHYNEETGECECVVIEAMNDDVAFAVAHKNLPNTDTCSCCGDRWTHDAPYEIFNTKEEVDNFCQDILPFDRYSFIFSDGKVSYHNKREVSSK